MRFSCHGFFDFYFSLVTMEFYGAGLVFEGGEERRKRDLQIFLCHHDLSSFRYGAVSVIKILPYNTIFFLFLPRQNAF